MRLRKTAHSSIILFPRLKHTVKCPDRTRDERIQDRQNAFAWHQKHIYRPYQHFTYDPCSWSRDLEEKSKPSFSFFPSSHWRSKNNSSPEEISREHLSKSRILPEEKRKTIPHFLKNDDSYHHCLPNNSLPQIVRSIEQISEYLDSPRFERYITEKRKKRLRKKREKLLTDLFYRWINSSEIQGCVRSITVFKDQNITLPSLKCHICVLCLLLQYSDIIFAEITSNLHRKGSIEDRSVALEEEMNSKRFLENETERKRSINVCVKESGTNEDDFHFLEVVDAGPEVFFAQLSKIILLRVFSHNLNSILSFLPLESFIELFSIWNSFYSFFESSGINETRTCKHYSENYENFASGGLKSAQNTGAESSSSVSDMISMVPSLHSVKHSLLVALLNSLSERLRSSSPAHSSHPHIVNSCASHASQNCAFLNAPIPAAEDKERPIHLSEERGEILSPVMIQLFTQSLWQLCMRTTYNQMNCTTKNMNENFSSIVFAYRLACQIIKNQAEYYTRLLQHSLPSLSSPVHQLRAFANCSIEVDCTSNEVAETPSSISLLRSTLMLKKKPSAVNMLSSASIPCQGKLIRPVTSPEDIHLLLESITHLVWISPVLSTERKRQENKIPFPRGTDKWASINAMNELLSGSTNFNFFPLTNESSTSPDHQSKAGTRKLFQDCFAAVMEAIYFSPNYDLPKDCVSLFCSLCLEENSDFLLWGEQETFSSSRQQSISTNDIEIENTLFHLDNLYHIFLLLSRVEMQTNVPETLLCRLSLAVSKRGALIIGKGEEMAAACEQRIHNDNRPPLGYGGRKVKKEAEEIVRQQSKWLETLRAYVKECKRLQGFTLKRILSSSSVQAKHFYQLDTKNKSDSIVQQFSNSSGLQLPWEVHLCCYTKVGISNTLWVDACCCRGVWPRCFCGVNKKKEEVIVPISYSKQQTVFKSSKRKMEQHCSTSDVAERNDRECVTKEVYAALIDLRSRSLNSSLNVTSAECLLQCALKISLDHSLHDFRSLAEQEVKNILLETDWESVWSQFPNLTYSPAISLLLHTAAIAISSKILVEQKKVVRI